MTVDSDIAPFGHRLEAHAAVESTNDVALDRLRAGAPHGTVVAAGTQRAGRGRRGRIWWSPPGNLYTSFIVRPDPGAAIGQLAFIASVAAADAVGPDASVRFKWPNDLLVDGRKLGGILIESETSGAVIGIGINVAVAPAGDDYAATSLADLGLETVDARQLLTAVCGTLSSWYAVWRRDGFAPVREAWLSRAHGVGEMMTLQLPASRLSGVFAGLDADGALLMETDKGLRRFASGEVVFGHA